MANLKAKRILSTEDAARMLNVSTRHVLYQIDIKRLKATRVGRRAWAILPEDLAEFQRNKELEAAADEVADEAQDS